MASLRDDMPQVAAWIDQVRAVFCTSPESLAGFNAQLRAGMHGQPTFYARENGRTAGTEDRRPGVTLTPPIKTAQAPQKGRGRGAA